MTLVHPHPSADNQSPESSTVLARFDKSPQQMVQSPSSLTAHDLRARFTEACQAWLAKSPSLDTRSNYARDVRQFLVFIGADPTHLEQLAIVRPAQVAAWRDQLKEQGLTNSSIRRKMTAVRSLFSYLQSYGFAGVNPAH